MDAFDITFDFTGHGWADVVVSAPDFRHEICASELGVDPIDRLMAAVLEIATRPPPAPDEVYNVQVELTDEQASLTLVLRPEPPDLSIRVHYHPDGSYSSTGSIGKQLYAGSCPLDAFNRPIYDRVKSALVQYGFSGFGQRWREFPTARFLCLHRHLHPNDPLLRPDSLADELQVLTTLISDYD